MPYSVFVGVALAIHILISVDMFIKKDNVPAIKSYRWFLASVGLFYVSDLLWGIFDDNKIALATYIDTFFYFVLMGLTIFSWTWFVVKYLEPNKIFSIIFRAAGITFFLTEITLVIVNIFVPILFRVNFETSEYVAYGARYVMLWAQIGVYSILTIYSFIFGYIAKIKNHRRYVGIASFSVIMITCIAIQLGDPLIPFYSIGCLVGVCVLDTFALSETKETIKEALQESVQVNKQSEEQLDKVMHLAYTDPLTGVKSKHAYVEMEEQLDQLIAKHEAKDFAIAVFDLNGLKKINDTLGHNAGDAYIVKSIKIISKYFPFDSLYRFGGDEFVAILEGESFEERQKRHDEFLKEIEENIKKNEPVISSGISKFRPETDNTFRAVFYRADKLMYARKELLKEHKG